MVGEGLSRSSLPCTGALEEKVLIHSAGGRSSKELGALGRQELSWKCTWGSLHLGPFYFLFQTA